VSWVSLSEVQTGTQTNTEEDHMMTQGDDGVYKPWTEASEGTNSATP
jgi:hypothetical protein